MDGLNPRDTSTPTSKGHLNPTPTAPVARYPVPADLGEVARHFWVPEWDLPAGSRLTARVLGYPALNLVVEERTVLLAGSTSRMGERVLEGRGWAVGVLLRPAATLALGEDAGSLVDGGRVLDEPALAAAVTEAMTGPGPAAARHLAAAEVVCAWLRERLAPVTDQGRLANRAVALVEEDPEVHRVADLALRLHVTPRTLQRAVRRCTGFTPAGVIRRRRLQEAADLVAHGPGRDLSAVAQQAGYADHAHMTRDFRESIRETPSGLRGRP